MIAAIAIGVYLAACSVAVWTVPPRGVTWLGLLNFAVLQWFGVRRARVFETRERCVDMRVPADERDGLLELRFAKVHVQVGWRWERRVVPLTGWWSSFRYLGGRR